MSAGQVVRAAQSDRVVVAVPAFDSEDVVVGALESALAQRPVPDVHLFDNASDDDTVARAATLLPGSSIHVATTNAGAIANFELSFAETRGELFHWLATDDRWADGYLSATIAALRANPRAVAALPSVRFVDGAGAVESERPPTPGLDSGSVLRRAWAFVDQLLWVEFYALFRRERLAPHLPLPRGHGFDVVLSWRLLLRHPYCLAPAAVLEYRVYPEKTAASSAVGLVPAGHVTPLRHPDRVLWAALWAATRAPDLTRRARWAGRLALLTVIARRSGRARLLMHLRLPGRATRARQGWR